jgi:hypothetical protein
MAGEARFTDQNEAAPQTKGYEKQGLLDGCQTVARMVL